MGHEIKVVRQLLEGTTTIISGDVYISSGSAGIKGDISKYLSMEDLEMKVSGTVSCCHGKQSESLRGSGQGPSKGEAERNVLVKMRKMNQ
jgi:hypothetical protein